MVLEKIHPESEEFVDHAMSDTVPIVNLSSGDEEEIVSGLGEGLARFGFVNLVGHGVEAKLIDRAYACARDFFALSKEVKERLQDIPSGRQRGYTPFGVERAKDRMVGDSKEFWHVGRELPEEHSYRREGFMRPNLWPEEVPGFRETTLALFATMDALAASVLRRVGAFLGSEPDWLPEIARDGNSILRLIHYPDAGEGSAQAGSERAAPHEDVNLLTLLPAATAPGLQLLTREGEWLEVNPPEGGIVCDVGDMMTLLTEGRLSATTHRVVNPSEDPGGSGDGGRLSMPFFLHPRPDAVLSPPGSDKPGLTAHEFLHARLSANKVK